MTLLCCGLDGGMTGSSRGDFPMGDTECSRVCSLTSAQPGALWGTLSRAVSRAWGPLQEMTDTKVFRATVCKKDVWGCCRSRFRGRGEGFRHGEKLCSGRGGERQKADPWSGAQALITGACGAVTLWWLAPWGPPAPPPVKLIFSSSLQCSFRRCYPPFLPKSAESAVRLCRSVGWDGNGCEAGRARFVGERRLCLPWKLPPGHCVPQTFLSLVLSF